MVGYVGESYWGLPEGRQCENLRYGRRMGVGLFGWLSLGLVLGLVINLGLLLHFRLCFYISDYTLWDCFCFPSCISSLYNFRFKLAASAQL